MTSPSVLSVLSAGAGPVAGVGVLGAGASGPNDEAAPTTGSGFFTAEQLAAAAQVVREIGGENTLGLAYLGGSLAIGLGNVLSDIDLYVVGNGDSDDMLAEAPLAHTHNGTLVHLEVLSAARVERLVEMASEYRVTSADRSQILLDASALSALVHLVTRRTLLVEPQWSATLDQIDSDAVRLLLTTRYANLSATGAQDAVGALRSGDPYTALAGSAMALETAVEAVLAAHGDFCSSPKFLMRRLARTPFASDWMPSIWELLHGVDKTVPNISVDAAQTLVEARLGLGSYLLACVVLDGWDLPLAHLSLPTAVTGEGLQRNPYLTPIRFLDGIGLMGPDSSWRISPQMLRIWRALPALPDGGSPGNPQTRAAVDDLVAAGAVRAPNNPSRDPDLVIEPATTFDTYPRVHGRRSP